MRCSREFLKKEKEKEMSSRNGSFPLSNFAESEFTLRARPQWDGRIPLEPLQRVYSMLAQFGHGSSCSKAQMKYE